VKLTVLGAGAWGTALAAHAALRRPVTLWARDPAQAQALRADRCNRRYLPEVALPAGLSVTDDFEAAVRATAADGLLLIATPMDGLEPTLQRLAGLTPIASQGPAIGWLCKGFQRGSGALGHEIARRVMPGCAPVVVSGPSFALEVGRGQPTALVAASVSEASARRAVEALHDRTLRVYTSSDPVGVEVGGAVKNVLAIATGIADGLPWGGAGSAAGLGLNARAALITRGLAEMTRLGAAMGARTDTFMGLGGLGDLVLTATGSLSRNRQVGLALAQGQPLQAILATLGHVAEGVLSAPVVLERAQRLGVDMPITEAVVAVLGGRLLPAAALTRLLERDARAEGT
jgi:glycerol-3-phosphate dehydrogenase (NAD(P)+)